MHMCWARWNVPLVGLGRGDYFGAVRLKPKRLDVFLGYQLMTQPQRRMSLRPPHISPSARGKGVPQK